MASKNAIRPENLHVPVLGFRTTQYDKNHESLNHKIKSSFTVRYRVITGKCNVCCNSFTFTLESSCHD